jgi:hypothetical protein
VSQHGFGAENVTNSKTKVHDSSVLATRCMMTRCQGPRTSRRLWRSNAKRECFLWLLLILSSLALSTIGCARKQNPNESAPRETSPPSLAAGGRVTFVQITDPHLFDAGERLHGEGIDAEALDNRAAFHWAVLTTNRLELAEKRRIDFVVLTGDFGLWNVTLPDRNGQPSKKCDCPKKPKGEEGPIPPVPLHEAAVEAAKDLDALVVRDIFLVPGNNDLCDESPVDLHRWAEFVFELNQVLKERESERVLQLTTTEANGRAGVSARKAPRVVDLTYSLERLYAQHDPRITALYPTGGGPGRVPNAPTFSGISLLGLNSAYFKPHPPRSDGTNPLQQASDRASEKELEFVRDRISAGGSYLLFTHVPDVEDPYRGSGTGSKKQILKVAAAGNLGRSVSSAESDPGSSWKLTSHGRAVWHDDILERSEVVAVFAGHFHSSNRNLYPHNFTGLHTQPDEIVASKLWIAPPLAAKYQERIPPAKTARGLLLAHITTDGGVRVSSKTDAIVEPEPVWVSTLDQEAAAEGDEKLTEARVLELDHDWESAAAQYKGALTMKDPRVRVSAQQGFEHARAITRTWWWRLGKWFPPIRWLHFYHRATLAGISIALAMLIAPKLLGGVGILGYAGQFLQAVFMPRFRGKARVIAPVSLTTNSPIALFAAQIPLSALEVRRRWERAGLSFLSGGTTLLSLPSAIADQMAQNFPDVYKISLGKYLAFLVTVSRYFTWRVESQLAYCPNADAAQGAQGPGRMHAFASLRWGWFTQCSFKVSPRAASPLESDKAAYAVAARVLAAPWSNP